MFAITLPLAIGAVFGTYLLSGFAFYLLNKEQMEERAVISIEMSPPPGAIELLSKHPVYLSRLIMVVVVLAWPLIPTDSPPFV